MAGVTAASLLVACSGGDTPSADADTGAGVDAAQTGADVGVTPDTGLGDDSSTATDASEAAAAADSNIDANAPPDSAADGGAGVDAPTDVLADTSSSPDGVTVGDDAADVATTDDGSPADGATDAIADSGVSPGDATVEDSAANDATTSGDSATTGADAAIDAGAAPDAASDAVASADAPSDAGDANGAPLYDFTFDTTNESWWLDSTYPATTSSGAPSALKLNSSSNGSTAFGDPAGSLVVYAAFDDGGEKATVGYSFTPPVDLTGRTISMDIYLEGGSQQFTYFYLFLQDQNWDWMDPGPATFPPVPGGQWTSVTLDVDNPAGYVSKIFDRTNIALLGVELDSGSGAGPGTITPVTVFIDNVIVR